MREESRAVIRQLEVGELRSRGKIDHCAVTGRALAANRDDTVRAPRDRDERRPGGEPLGGDILELSPGQEPRDILGARLHDVDDRDQLFDTRERLGGEPITSGRQFGS